MSITKRLKPSMILAKDYRSALEEGISAAPDCERSLYDLHRRALDDLIASFASDDDVEAIAIQLRRERRSFGWSFLAGEHGQAVETRFHKFATDLENQIISLKGKDWYYSL